MRIPRVCCEQALAQGMEIDLGAANARHLLTVLRLAAGDRVRVFDGRGSEYEAELLTDRPPLRARLDRRIESQTESGLKVTVAQSLAKGERMDYALQKCVELGVHSIQPLMTERSVVKLATQRIERKMAHWQGVLVAACEQCGRTRLPGLAPPCGLSDWLGHGLPAATTGILLDPAASTSLARVEPEAGGITLLVGPEGGLSPGEIDQAREAGYIGVTLGPRILRTETAATVALSILQARFGDLV